MYILSVLIVGILVPSNDPSLDDKSGTAAQSPFVTAATRAGISVVPSIINAVVLTSAWSAANQSLLAGTRILYGLAIKKQAPKIFLRTTKWGIPFVCVILQTLVATLAYMGLSNGALTVFYWLLDLTACGTLISWSAILFNHIRLHQALKKQGISSQELPWSNWWTRMYLIQPICFKYLPGLAYSSRVALVACIMFLLTSGFSVFVEGNWDTATFISSYLWVSIH
jgi:amino acid transporter